MSKAWHTHPTIRVALYAGWQERDKYQGIPTCILFNHVTTTPKFSRNTWRQLLTQGTASHPDSYLCNSPIKNRHPASPTTSKSRKKSETFSCERALKNCYDNDSSWLIICRLMMTVFSTRLLIISKGLGRVTIRCNEKSLLQKHLMYIQQGRLCIQVDRQ